MIARIRRFIARQKWMGDYERTLNHRSDVEDYLLRASAGKEPLPDKKKCAQLAKKLGVPEHIKP
jgi:hypothetical protein